MEHFMQKANGEKASNSKPRTSDSGQRQSIPLMVLDMHSSSKLIMSSSLESQQLIKAPLVLFLMIHKELDNQIHSYKW